MNGQNYGREPGRNIPPMTEEQRRAMQQRRAEMQRTQPPQNPQNANRPRPVRSSPAPQKKSPVSSRNNILAMILIGLIVVFLLILGIQSCSKKESGDSGKDREKNNIILNGETSGEKSGGDEVSPAFAEYTDKTKTLNIDSGYGILIDLSDNTVIASKNGEDKIFPASMTKIMTLIVAYENAESLDDTFTFNAELLDPLYAQNASEAGFAAGETVCIRDMLYGCILPSGADATVGLACAIAGSEKDFVKLMNAKVKELGLKNTHFVTVSGLHDNNHYSTCHEMAIILEYAISDPFMREVLSTYKYTTAPTTEHPEGIELTSTLFSRMAGDEAGEIFVQGGKTGFTNEGLNCLATFAARCTEDMAPFVKPEYLLVTAYASGEYSPVFDAINVYKTLCTESAG